jgi:glycosyltransferase involved in cell wall biosynthesis
MPDGHSVLIIIPTYNRAGMLPEAIESALAQDYSHKRLVIVDDGSTDGTRSICSEYARRFPEQITYTHKPNGGCASARNAGLDCIDDGIGYVCFLDSDDRFLPGKLSREVSLLQRNPDAEFVYGDSIIFDEDTSRETRSRVAAAGRPEKFALMHFFTNEAKSSALMYRARTVRYRRFREDLRYNEDSEFLQRIAIECRGIYSANPGCWVRWHKGSKSRNFVEIHKAVLRASKDILESHPDFHRSHKKKLDWRIRQIEHLLFKELLIAGRWDEANRLVANPLKRFLSPCFSLYYRSLRRLGDLLRKMM